MKKNYFYLPKKIQEIILFFDRIKIPAWISFLVVGLVSTLWFLIRVIPKPSRASYPCMHAATPFISSFVLYLISLGGSIFAFKKFRQNISKSKFNLAFFFLFIAVLSSLIYLFSDYRFLLAGNNSKGDAYSPNAPMGIAQGIFPGRVAWAWDANATNENCMNTANKDGVITDADNVWFQAKNKNQSAIDTMVAQIIRSISGQQNILNAWDAIFRFHNLKRGKGNVGYNSNEIVFFKINSVGAYGNTKDKFNSDLSHRDVSSGGFPFTAQTDAFVILSVLKQLVNIVGIPQNKIYIGDPLMNIFKEDYDVLHAVFPNINYLGNSIFHKGITTLSILGRIPVEVGHSKIFYSDLGKEMPTAIVDSFYTIYDQAEYLINMPCLKAHARGGVTLTAKNHFGSHSRASAAHLHDGLVSSLVNDQPDRTDYKMYRVQVDLMEHKLLGGKTLIYIVDGLFGGNEAQCTPEKWTMTPFNNDWPSSVIASLDPVAVESVCFDLLRTEFNGLNGKTNRPNFGAVDDYMHQAADSNNWAPGIHYDPEKDGVKLFSIGVHEHWNDAIHKQYTRDLGTGNGIELIKIGKFPTLGYGDGLNAEYFNGINFDTSAMKRIDKVINFDWTTGSPDGIVKSDNFSARWTGFIMPTFSETYTFYTYSNDGVKQWVNGNLVVNNWTSHTAIYNNSTPITLNAGCLYEIKMEYFELNGTATAKLEWSSISQARQVIPQTQFFSAKPIVSFILPKTTFCSNDSKVTLTGGLPIGGVYSGSGVINNSFDPSIAGIGTHLITYKYPSSGNCSDAAVAEVNIVKCTGILENTENKLTVFPNPTKGLINIVRPDANAMEIMISNIQGQIIYKHKIEASGNKTISIDLSQHTQGVYLIKVISGNNLFTSKCLKN